MLAVFHIPGSNGSNTLASTPQNLGPHIPDIVLSGTHMATLKGGHCKNLGFEYPFLSESKYHEVLHKILNPECSTIDSKVECFLFCSCLTVTDFILEITLCILWALSPNLKTVKKILYLQLLISWSKQFKGEVRGKKHNFPKALISLDNL